MRNAGQIQHRLGENVDLLVEIVRRQTLIQVARVRSRIEQIDRRIYVEIERERLVVLLVENYGRIAVNHWSGKTCFGLNYNRKLKTLIIEISNILDV